MFGWPKRSALTAHHPQNCTNNFLLPSTSWIFFPSAQPFSALCNPTPCVTNTVASSLQP